MADTCQNTSIQVSLSLIFPLILIRLTWGLKQIPRKNESKMSSLAVLDKDLVKKLLTSSLVFLQI